MKIISKLNVWLLLAGSMPNGFNPAAAQEMDGHNDMGGGSSSTTTSTTTTSTTTSTTAQGAGALLWSEEFNAGSSGGGSSRPNSDLWSYDVGSGWGFESGELQEYTDSTSNCAVEGGFLKIVARDEGSSFTSARIKTEDKLSFKYGTLEIRAQWPQLNAGLLPAFWTLGANFKNQGWPRSGEVGIMQGGQGIAIQEGKVNNRVVSAAHWDNDGSYATSTQSYDSPVDLTQGFHNYRLEWTPQEMQTFVDDQLVWRMSIDRDGCANCGEFHQHHFMVLSMAVGGGFTSTGSGCGSTSPFVSSESCPLRGPDDITAPLPGELSVDWIRLYQNGFSEVILGSGSVFVAQSGTSSGTSAVSTSTQVVCSRDIDCDFDTQWCELATSACFDKSAGGISCSRDRGCWSGNCRNNFCSGGAAPAGFSSSSGTSGSMGSGNSVSQPMPASDVVCVRDIDCDFDTQWCEIDTSTCFEKRAGGLSCSRDRGCWSENCRNALCSGGAAPAGFSSSSGTTGGSTGTSTSTTSTTTGGSTGTATTTATTSDPPRTPPPTNRPTRAPTSGAPTKTPTKSPTPRPTSPPTTPGPTNPPTEAPVTPGPTNPPTEAPVTPETAIPVAATATPATSIPVAATATPATSIPVAATATPATSIPVAGTATPATSIPVAATATPATAIPVAATAIPATAIPVAATFTPATSIPVVTSATAIPVSGEGEDVDCFDEVGVSAVSSGKGGKGKGGTRNRDRRRGRKLQAGCGSARVSVSSNLDANEVASAEANVETSDVWGGLTTIVSALVTAGFAVFVAI